MRLFYYLSSCDTCKRIAKELPLNDSITQVDIKKNPLTTTQIEDLYQRVGNYEQLINKRAQLYKQRNLKDKNLQEEDYKNLLLEHYTFLKRPIVVFDDHIFIGNGAQTVADAKAFLNEQYGTCFTRSFWCYHHLWYESYYCKSGYAALYRPFWVYNA